MEEVMTTKFDAYCCYCKQLVPAGTGECWKFSKTNRWYVGCDDCVEAKRSERKSVTKSSVFIEFPSKGATYFTPKYGVYEYDIYPKSSVLAGQERRTYINEFDTLEEAKAKFPNAEVSESRFTGYCEAESF